MRYTVVWQRGAKAALGNLWLGATDRQAVADASDRIDLILRDDPGTKGKPFGKFFILDEAPLSVLYHADSGDCMVRVFSVKRI